MTCRLTIGIDPGISGALAVLADGQFERFIDIPTRPRRTAAGNEVDVTALAARLRETLAAHPGAYAFGVMEKVCGHRGQGGAASFNFGQADGMVRATFESVGIPFIEVYPQTWKMYLRMKGMDKEAARQRVICEYPEAASQLKRKKDHGRADALLLAKWAELTEQVARRSAA